MTRPRADVRRFLLREPYRSASTVSEYNTDTLLIRHPFELGYGAVGKKVGWDLHAAALHEDIHWFHHHGTVVGAFLANVRRLQSVLAVRCLRALPRDVRRKLVTEGDAPVVTIDSDAGCLAAPVTGNEEYRTSRDLWYLAQGAYAFFDDHRATLGLNDLGTPSAFAAASILALLPAGQSFDIADAARFYSGSDAFQGVEAPNGELTVRLIMEGACRANEAYHLGVGVSMKLIDEPDPETLLRSLLDDLSSGPYSTAFVVFLAVAEPREANVLDLLRTFVVLCDTALNAALPPAVLPSSERLPRWADMHPVPRFLELCRAAKAVGLFTQPLVSPAMVTEYERSLCDAADVMYVDQLAAAPDGLTREAIEALHQTIEGSHAGSLEQAMLSTITRASCFDYIHFVEREFWHARPLALTHLIFHMTGIAPQEHEHEHLFELDPDNLWVQSPLVWLGEYLAVRASKVGGFGFWLVLSTAIHYRLFDVMAVGGPFSAAAFPQGVRSAIVPVTAAALAQMVDA